MGVLADADVVMWHRVPYESFWGHHGVIHSPFFLILFSCLLAYLSLKTAQSFSIRSFCWLTGAWSTASVLHPLMDAMTFGKGVKGVMLLYPFNQERIFFPWRPILAANVGLGDLWGSFSEVFPMEWPFCVGAIALGLTGFFLTGRNNKMAT